MGGINAQMAKVEAQVMLDSFASVGATSFDLTWTTRAGEKEHFRRSVSLAELSRTLPAMLDEAASKERNVIVRPHGPGVTFIQLDDLKPDTLSPIAPAVFLSLQTSPGNFQAWVAIPDSEDKDFARRLRKGTGADPTASGATRVAGSINFKDKYAPDFPRVTIHQTSSGRVTQAAELEGLGLVAEPEAPPPARPPARSRPHGTNRRWPSYERCIDGAPLNHDQSRPDTSKADFVWCMTALDWGWSKGETVVRLMEESAKAQENGERYVVLTVNKAAEAVKRRQNPRSHQAAGPERR